MRKTLIAALLAAGLAAPLAAQDAPAQPQAGNTAADRERGALIFRTFLIAFNSDKVDAAVKNQLAACLYNNPMRTISVATGQTFARNSGLDEKNPSHVYAVASQVCGVKPAQSTEQPAQAPAQPTR